MCWLKSNFQEMWIQAIVKTFVYVVDVYWSNWYNVVISSLNPTNNKYI